MNGLLELLFELQDYMDDRSDSVDDRSGQPTANTEMRLSEEIGIMIGIIKQGSVNKKEDPSGSSSQKKVLR
jgi:hypothetical protein